MSSASSQMSSRNLSVLLVEDSRVLAERLRETLLSVPGVQLAGTVDSEADAVAALQRQPVDVVLLDLHLRQGTGFGVLRAIPERPGQEDGGHRADQLRSGRISASRGGAGCAALSRQAARLRSPADPAAADRRGSDLSSTADSLN